MTTQVDLGRPCPRVEIDIAAGSTVAIVGRSGSGKSSLVNALGRLWPISAGAIEIDRIDIETVTARSLHRQLGIVSQDSHLFYGTVRDNLLAASPEADDKTLWNALRSADAEQVVQTMTGGFDANIGDRGATVPGGERQRIALARALLSDTSLAKTQLAVETEGQRESFSQQGGNT